MKRREWIHGAAIVSMFAATTRSSVVHALCAAPQFQRWVHGDLAAPRPASAGIVVVESEGASPVLVDDVATLRLIGPSGTETALVSRAIADSIVVLRPEAPLSPGRFSTRGFRVERPLTLDLTGATLTPPVPPRVAAVQHRVTTHTGRGRTMTTGSLRLAVPGVAAGTMLIARWSEGSVLRDTWGIVDHDASVELASSARCSGHGRFPPQGIAITLHTLDAFGQLSSGSTPVRIPPPS